MTLNLSPRELPKYVLKSAPTEYKHWEGQYVQDKFANPLAQVEETNTDYQAMLYMNDQSILYWLPRFLKYLEVRAPRTCIITRSC